MPAKFVNLIQFFEFKILPELKMVRFIEGCLYRNAVVMRIYLVYIAPNEEFLLWQVGDTDAGMMDGQVFLRTELFFQVEEVEIGGAEDHMHQPEDPGTIQQECDADAQEKEEFYQAEEKVYPGHGLQDIGPCKYQYQDIHCNQQETTQVEIIGMMGKSMGNGVQKDEAGGCKVQEATGTLQLLEIGMHYRKGKGIHTVQFV